MRPTKLTISAFGSYADKVEIDFNELGEHGLYIVTGNTGVGKTTIFNGIVYALYGDKERETELRSKYASDEVETFVELEFVNNGEIYTVRRNPSYSRKKKRGSGTTNAPADVMLTLPDGNLLGKKDGADEYIRNIVIGIDKKQFMQIVMIEQGNFKKMLLAKSNDKEEIFRKIFETDLFRKFQDELDNEKKKTEEKYSKIEDEKKLLIRQIQVNDNCIVLGELLDSRVMKTLESILNEDEQRKSELSEKSEQLEEQCNQIKNQQYNLDQYIEKSQELTDTQKKAEENMESLLVAEQNYRNAKSKEEKIENLKKEKFRLEQDLSKYDELDKLQKQCKNCESDLERYRKEQNADTQTQQQEDQRRQNYQKQSENLADVFVKKRTLEDTEKIFFKQKESLTNILTTKEKFIQEYENLENYLERKREQENKIQNYQEKSKQLENCYEEKSKYERQATELKGKLEKLKDIQKQNEEYHDKQKEYREERTQLEKAAIQKEHREREFNQKQKIRNDHNAGILAQSFKENPDMPCPVCGSTHHPKIAVIPEHIIVPSENDLELAEKKYRKANEEYQKYTQSCTEISATIRTIRENIEKDLLPFSIVFDEHCLETINACIKAHKKTLQEIQNFFDKAEQNIEEKKKLDKETENVRKNIDEYKDKINKVCINIETYRTQITENQKNLEDNTDFIAETVTVDDIRVKQSAVDKELSEIQQHIQEETKKEEQKRNIDTKIIPDIQKRLDTLKENISNRKPCIAQCETNIEHYRTNIQNLKSSLAFSDKLSAKYEIENLQKQIQILTNNIENATAELDKCRRLQTQLDTTIGNLKEELQKPEMKAVENISEANLNAQYQSVYNQKSQNNNHLNEVEDRIKNNKKISFELAETIKALEKVRNELNIIQNLSDTANGKLNQTTKISFEKYVLQYYFKRILQRANQRLFVMSEQQYEMVIHEEESFSKNVGLDIDVIDHFNNTVRSVATLSGGESFQASLALALGLADEVQANQGGIHLDSMFIDEGFGTLDKDALQQAMKILYNLAGNNKLIGIISHVDALKEMECRKIQVVKTRENGSRIKII